VGVGIVLSSSGAVVASIAAARDVAFGAYVLRDGAIRSALVEAARDGANVAVTLAADPYADANGELGRENARTAAVLQQAGARVTLSHAAVHLKAAVCDGVAYLDDRNWGPDGLVIRDDMAADVVRVRDALEGRDDGPADGIALGKRRALAEEAALIERSGDSRIVVATEAFGVGPVADAVLQRAERGAATTLIVDRRELDRGGATFLRRFARLGVDVKTSVADEKFVLAGDVAWVGSANATSAHGVRGDQSDWGLITADPQILSALRAKC
jgi:phosphatidylserine/phosphatidylglycerophosphate/cardiolipin synthase-like enzyme